MAQEINLGEVISDSLSKRYHKLKDHFSEYEVEKASLLHKISLTLIILIAFIVRLFPTLRGWDPILKAFDPYMQLRSASFILDQGIFKFFTWRDSITWYPYGREVGSSMYIIIPLAIILVYSVAHVLGFSISLTLAAYMVPIIFGTAGVIYSYYLAKETISARAGLVAALIMSITPAFVSRSIGGFTDNESVGVLLSVMTFYYFMRALNKDSLPNAVYAGISLAALSYGWGAYRFAYDLLALYAFVLVITGKFSQRLLRIYTTTIFTTVGFMVLLPRVGGTFILGFAGIVPIAMIAFLIFVGFLQETESVLKKQAFRKFILLSFLTIAIIFTLIGIVMYYFGNIQAIGDKFISVIIPGDRNSLPLIDSVSEHQPLNWGAFYHNMSTMVFFIPAGVYFALKKPTEKNLFILTLGLTAIYFSGSMIRLMLVLAPAAVLLTALAVDGILVPYGLISHKRIKISKSTMRMDRIGNQQTAISYIVVFVLLSILVSSGISTASNSTTPEIMLALSQNAGPESSLDDWHQTFDWMQKHTAYEHWLKTENTTTTTPPVMLSWWDYGDYLTVNGGTITLVDNATTNSTQIGVVGTMLMWNASAAINLMYKYNVQYVMVYSAAGILGWGSDIAKSTWMIKISEQYTPEFQIHEKDYYKISEGGYYGKYMDSVLARLSAYKAVDQTSAGAPFASRDNMQNTVAGNLKDFTVTDLTYFSEVFRSDGYVQSDASPKGDFPIIRIFKVLYPADIELRVAEFDQTMARIRATM